MDIWNRLKNLPIQSALSYAALISVSVAKLVKMKKFAVCASSALARITKKLNFKRVCPKGHTLFI
jgi:hypothetical protein